MGGHALDWLWTRRPSKDMRGVLLVLAALPCVESITYSHGGQQSVLPRPRFAQTSTAPPPVPEHSLQTEGDDALIALRRSVQQIRQLRRQTRAQALRLSRSSRAAAEAVYAEAERYETALADLEDIQRTLVRSAKAGMLRERRSAERKFREWRSTHEWDHRAREQRGAPSSA